MKQSCLARQCMAVSDYEFLDNQKIRYMLLFILFVNTH